jgi:Uma2 family endonuclease
VGNKVLMTVEELLRIPESAGEYSYELHQGVVVPVTRPRLKHTIMQGKLRRRLAAVAQPGGFAESELPFRPLREHELRVADVAYVCPERWKDIDPEDVFRTTPDLVIEVLSPSDMASELFEKEQLCLENGCREFWVVDGKRRQVRVTTAAGRVTIYKSGQSVPLTVCGDGELPVDSIFA